MKKRKILSLLLSLCLLISLLPTVALAADQTNDGAGIRIQYVDGSYDKTTGIMKVRVQAKMPAGTGITTIGTLLSWDNTKLSLVSQADTSYDYTPADGSDVDTLDDAMKTIMATKTKTGPNRAGNYEVTDGKVYTKDTRTALYTYHANTKSLQYVANDAQTGGNWFDVYEVMFRVAGKPADPATVLNSDSLRIADVAKGDAAVMKGAFPANNLYSIYLTDNSDPARLYVLNRMSECTDTEVTGANSLMTAPETGTATYPGSTNSVTPPAPATYTVTVQDDGNGTASASPATAAAGTEITLSATANSGYHFKEWQVVSGTVTIAGNKFAMPSSDVTVKAIFEADAPTTYTVTVQDDGNGTASASPATAAAGTEITLSATANSGYHFKEWQVVSGTVTIAGNKFAMPSSDVTVKAIFEADAPTTYTVSFDANGGTGTMADVTGISGSYTLPANGFTAPAGKQFKGWATSASGTVITGTSITVSADTTLYAIWETIPATEYTITFNGNGGTPSAGTMSTIGGKLTSLPTATRSGSYSFDGWYTAASGGTQITTAYVFSANTTVYAHWTYTGGGGGSYYAPTVPDMPMLYRGCTGDAVKTLQEKLNAKGFDSGNVDGIFGAKTYAAATAFQKANGLGVDGIVGKLTWAKLYDATPVNVTPVTTQPMLRTGSRGDAVRKLQELLNAKGYTCGSVDGIFGSKTYAAVLAFQKANGLGADGIVGPLTWGKLV